MDYAQALKYLNRFVNYEKQSSFPKEILSLDKPREFFFRLGINYGNLKFIHIAGTKGKGSTAQFCASIVAQSGLKAGLYTSPHIADFRERIKIVAKQKEAMISTGELAKIVTDFAAKLTKADCSRYTYFEITTALALEYFCRAKVDYVVLEVGLGGRLDATNVVTPKVSVLTPIDFDHTHILGKTLPQIAREKAGIIKENGVVLSSAQDPEARAVIEEVCRNQRVRLYLEGRDFFVSNIMCKKNKTVFDFSLRNSTVRGLEIVLKGEHQAHNAALACAALAALDKPFNFKGGLKKAKLFGRFSEISKKPLIVLDVAHNEISFNKLALNLKTYYSDKKVILIFACARDKDILAMLGAYKWKKIFLPKIKNERLFSPCQIQQMVKDRNIFVCRSVREALRKAKTDLDRDDMIVIAGSFFLAGELPGITIAQRISRDTIKI